MKTYKLYTLLIGLGLLLASCMDNFLDSTSKRELVDDNFYKTIDDAEMALIGCYDGYQRSTSDGGMPFYLASEILSDDCFGGTGHSDSRDRQVLDRFDIAQSPGHTNLFETNWAAYYRGIYRCNMLLMKLDGINFDKEPEARPRIEGETRFLRALMYFDLVRLFENIPLLTEPSAENIPQAHPIDVYKLIVEDLVYAAGNIPANAYPKAQANENDGRVTCYAAKALLARVYLFYTGYYGKEDLGVTKAEVLAGLEDVIKSKEYSLLQEYKSLWPASGYKVIEGVDDDLDRTGFAGKGNKEIVFAQKFNNTSNYNGYVDGNAFIVLMGLRNTTFAPYGKGWGSCTVNPQFVASFAPLDKRKEASVIDIVQEGIIDRFDLADQREYTGYTVKKYTPTGLPNGADDVGGDGSFQISQDQDYVIIRYADVLLMAAELGSPNAQDYYDEVRKRAGLDPKPVSLQNILEERHFELAFEGIRYWDLLRQGLDVAANTIATSQTLLSGGVEEQITIQAENIKKTRGFMQIPGTEISKANGVLVQNPGW